MESPDGAFLTLIREGFPLPEALLQSFDERGFVVVPNRLDAAVVRGLPAYYDEAVANADPVDVSAKNCTRVHDFVNRREVFDALWLDPLLLGLCAYAMKRPFKLGSFLSRTVNPNAHEQALHQDHPHQNGEIYLLGFLWMIDDFHCDNGATRFVPASCHQATKPQQEPILATGAAGTLIVYDGAIWHGYSKNSTSRPRRSLQGAYVWRDGKQRPNQRERLQEATAARLSDLGRYLLDVLPL